MAKIQTSSFTKHTVPEIDSLAIELLTIETKLGELNEASYIKNFAIYQSDVALDMSRLEESNIIELFNFFKAMGQLADSEAENGIESASDNFAEFAAYIQSVESIHPRLSEQAFGSFAFSQFDYRYKDSEEALAYQNEGYPQLEYEVSEIERRDELLKQLAAAAGLVLADSPVQQYYLCSSMSDPSNATEEVSFWIQDKLMIACTSYHFV